MTYNYCKFECLQAPRPLLSANGRAGRARFSIHLQPRRAKCVKQRAHPAYTNTALCQFCAFKPLTVNRSIHSEPVWLFTGMSMEMRTSSFWESSRSFHAVPFYVLFLSHCSLSEVIDPMVDWLHDTDCLLSLYLLRSGPKDQLIHQC